MTTVPDSFTAIWAFKYPMGFKYPAAFIFDFVDAYGPKMTVHRFLKLTLANPGKSCSLFAQDLSTAKSRSKKKY